MWLFFAFSLFYFLQISTSFMLNLSEYEFLLSFFYLWLLKIYIHLQFSVTLTTMCIFKLVGWASITN